jgi:hypothetical protein
MGNGAVAAGRDDAWIRDDAVRSVEYGIARDARTLDQAFRLIHDRFVQRGYIDPRPSGRRLGVHHALPWTMVFVAVERDRVGATVTLVEDSPIGLPMDELYGPELAAFRRRGRLIAEASSFATLGAGAVGLAVVMRLFRMVLAYAGALARVDDVCFLVHPHHVDFYREFFEARPFADVRAYDKVNGAPAVPLQVDLGRVRSWMATVAADVAGATPLHRFLYDPGTRRTLLAALQRELARDGVTPAGFLRAFGEEAVFSGAPAGAVAFVRSLCRGVGPSAAASGGRGAALAALAAG